MEWPITDGYYSGIQGAIIMFDLTRASTFKEVEPWFNICQSRAPSDVRYLLVGSHSDMPGRKVVAQDAIDLAESLGMEYMEISTKEINVDQVFSTLATAIKYQRIPRNKGKKRVRHFEADVKPRSGSF